MERRLAAILAADVQGYSRLTEADEEASTTALRSHRAVVEDLIAKHRGHVFSSAGDGLVAEFPSIVEAIRCALAIQKEVSSGNADLPKDQQMRFRIGVNLGDVIAEGNNLYGTGVNVGVRLEQMAEPGGILISQTVYEQVRKIVDITFEDVGERRLKNISEPIRVYRVHPGPLPWTKRWLSRTHLRRQAGAIAGILFLLLSLVAAGAIYWRPTAPLSLLDALREPWLPDKASVAVMPFENRSGEDQQHLADGLTEDVITALSKFPDLTVKSRMSTFNYAGAAGDIGEKLKKLNVRYVLNASITTLSDRVRVSAELVDTSTDAVRWRNKFDRQLSEIFAVRDEIAQTIVTQLGGLQGEFVRAELDRVKRKDPHKFTAYNLVLQGWSEWYGFSRESNANAREKFEMAKTIDPTYARAYAGLAWTYSLDHDFGWTDDYKQAVQKAMEYASKAVELDENDYQSHWALGWAQLHSRLYDKAIASYKRARSLNPHDAEVLAEMANLTVCLGKPKEAVEQLKEAIRLTPFHDDWYEEYLGWAYEEAGEPEKAIETLGNVVTLKPKKPIEAQRWVMPTLAAAYAEVGRMAEAQKVVETINSFDAPHSISYFLARVPYQSAEQAERYKNAVRKAGLSD
jgi:class 3 adenylate cyclase/TolB-like protein/Tfp pilus assembly protein PilF